MYKPLRNAMTLLCSFITLATASNAFGQASTPVSADEVQAFRLTGSLVVKFKHKSVDVRTPAARIAQRDANVKAFAGDARIQNLPLQDRQMIAQSNQKVSEHFAPQSDAGKMIYDGNQISLTIARSSSEGSAPERSDISPQHSFQHNGDATLLYNRADTLPLINMPPLPVNMGSYNPIRALSVGGNMQIAFSEPWQKDIQGPDSKDIQVSASQVSYTLRDGAPLVSGVRLGDAKSPYCTLQYSGHKRIGNVWLPGRIVKRMYAAVPGQSNDLQLASEEEWTITDYSQNATAIDDPMKTLSSGNLVQDDDGKTTVSFSYDPSKSIESQHAIALTTLEAIDGAPKTETMRRVITSSTLLVVAGVSLLIYWAVRRRKQFR